MDNRDHQSKKLDEAVEKTFPASDPVNVGNPTGTEPPAHPGRPSGAHRHQG